MVLCSVCAVSSGEDLSDILPGGEHGHWFFRNILVDRWRRRNGDITHRNHERSSVGLPKSPLRRGFLSHLLVSHSPSHGVKLTTQFLSLFLHQAEILKTELMLMQIGL